MQSSESKIIDTTYK